MEEGDAIRPDGFVQRQKNDWRSACIFKNGQFKNDFILFCFLEMAKKIFLGVIFLFFGVFFL